METRLIDTTVGRVLFNRVLAPDVQFMNRTLDKGGVKDLIAEVLELTDEAMTTDVADKIKDIGFEYATRSGITVAVSDITIPDSKIQIVSDAMEDEQNVERDFRRGLLTAQEKNDRVIEIWTKATDDTAKAVKETMDPESNLAIQANSGAGKGGFSTISQLAGMRGMMADPAGRIIPLPIRSNFREGLNTLEYFISTHGSRKGLADTALRTADAGYLTRRLVDVAQDVITIADDCETENGIWIRSSDDIAGQTLGTRIFGRVLAKRVVHPETGEVLAERNTLLDKDTDPQDRECRFGRSIRALSVDLRSQARYLRPVLRPGSGPRPDGRTGCRRRDCGCPVDRRAGYPADPAYLPLLVVWLPVRILLPVSRVLRSCLKPAVHRKVRQSSPRSKGTPRSSSLTSTATCAW